MTGEEEALEALEEFQDMVYEKSQRLGRKLRLREAIEVMKQWREKSNRPWNDFDRMMEAALAPYGDNESVS